MKGEKNKYHILTFICGNCTKWYRLAYVQKGNRDTDVETNVWTPRGEGMVG